MKTALSPLRRLDQWLLLDHPELWLLRLPLVHAVACLLLLLSLPVALAPLSMAALPDPSSLRLRIYLISGAGSLGWMYVQYRDSRSLPFRATNRWYPRMLGFWYCLMVINAPAVLSSWVMHERVARLVDPITVEQDIALIREMHACIAKDWYECPVIKANYSTILSRYGFNEEAGSSYLVSLWSGDRLAEAEKRVSTLRKIQLERTGIHATNSAEESPPILCQTTWNMSVTTFFAALFVFIGSAQWASFMWFLAPILLYLALPVALSGIGLKDPSVVAMLLLLVLVGSGIYVARARKKSPVLAAAWGLLNFAYPILLIATIHGAGAFLLYAVMAPFVQDTQNRLRALPS